VPITLLPRRKETFLTDPSASLAVASSVIDAGAIAGWAPEMARLTFGGRLRVPGDVRAVVRDAVPVSAAMR